LVTPEGSEAKFAPQSKATIEAVRQKFGLPKQFVLFVSRWEKYKGLPALLEAYDRLHQEFPDLGLVLCGRPDAQQPEVADLVNRAKAANPLVVTPGFVTDEELAALYSAATAYVHPSWYEGFGIMILEAFAAGAPVVTSNISSLPEVVGDAGLLIDPKNIDDLTTAIKRVVADTKLAETLRQKGFERVKQFSWKKMAEQTLQTYRQALAEHG
jgi:glycosyltransferase involved in cell wall biosynthesis